MKIAAISDIHGNLAALNAVLADIAQHQVDIIVNLGDILSGALQPCATADRLIPLQLPTIRGNHERQVLTQDPEHMGPSDRWAQQTLRPDQMAWLASLPSKLWLNEEVLLVHGTPASDLEYFLETVTPSACRPATLAEVTQRAADSQAKLILCGHTHLPRTMQLANGCLIVNPGSVGLQAYDDDRPFYHTIESGSPHARYALIEHKSDGWSAQLLSVAYDWEGAARLAAQHQRPDWEAALRTGRLSN